MEAKIKNDHSNNIEELKIALKEIGLTNLGMFQIDKDDKVLQGFETLLLIGPDEPSFWKKFKDSHEYNHINKDPLDHWSKDKITELAKNFGAKPFFPFQDNPALPFYSWALRSRRMWASPIKLLVHDTRGLMVSFRGALALKQKLVGDLIDAKKSPSPCKSCIAPCLASCPVGALTVDKYDVEKCQTYIKNYVDSPCRQGCLARRSCPIGKDFRQKEQSTFHMQAFLK